LPARSRGVPVIRPRLTSMTFSFLQRPHGHTVCGEGLPIRVQRVRGEHPA
jgi:hypothetical protein